MKKRVLIVFAVLLLLACFGIIIASRSGANPDSEVNPIKVEKRNVEAKVFAEGNVSGIDERSVFYPAGSTVDEVKVALNQKVSEGEVLALYSLGTQKELKSPINGVVTSLNFKKGDSTSPTIAGFNVVDNSKLVISSLINENDIPNLAKDQKVTISVPAVSLDKDFSGKVSFVALSPEQPTGAVNYRIEITPSDFSAEVKLGMSVDLEILTKVVENVLAVPDSYIIEKDEKFYLKKISSKTNTEIKTEEVEVSLGLRTDDYTEVKSGINVGDEIVEPNFTSQRSFRLF